MSCPAHHVVVVGIPGPPRRRTVPVLPARPSDCGFPYLASRVASTIRTQQLGESRRVR